MTLEPVKEYISSQFNWLASVCIFIHNIVKLSSRPIGRFFYISSQNWGLFYGILFMKKLLVLSAVSLSTLLTACGSFTSAPKTADEIKDAQIEQTYYKGGDQSAGDVN